MPSANEETPAFFLKAGLDSGTFSQCLELVHNRYPASVIEARQGGCSFTLVCSWKAKNDEEQAVVLQFRTQEYALPRNVLAEARAIYRALAPAPLWFGCLTSDAGTDLQVAAMTAIRGVSFGDVQPCQEEVADSMLSGLSGLRNLMVGMARFFALGWHAAAKISGERECEGKIGSSIYERLEKLEHGLPYLWLRRRVLRLKDKIQSGGLSKLPVVLSHGDLLPSNIMVHEKSWRLSGLVDWAEAEFLPFGFALYGIEHLLGFIKQSDHGRHRFVYYRQADHLRAFFESRLRHEIPSLKEPTLWNQMLVAREVGIFLWHGIAWDNGRLDRVVNAEDDREELAYLEAFLKFDKAADQSRL